MRGIEELVMAIQRVVDNPSKVGIMIMQENAELILEALKKQMPVNPYQFDDIWKCGKCGNGVVQYDELEAGGMETIRFDYCPICGQAVKWE